MVFIYYTFDVSLLPCFFHVLAATIVLLKSWLCRNVIVSIESTQYLCILGGQLHQDITTATFKLLLAFGTA